MIRQNIHRREFLRRSSAAALLSLLPRSGVWAASAASDKRPNVLFLFSDQHQAGVASYAGSANVSTPNFDRLTREGTHFARAYCQDGVCMPSRNSIYTGQYCRTLGLLANEDWNCMRPETISRNIPLQRIFKSAGYYTFTAGKRHLMPALDTDWDYAAGDIMTKPLDLWSREPRDNINYWNWVEGRGLLPQARADFAVEMGKSYGGPRQPLACAISKLPPDATMEAFAASQTIQFLKSAQAKKQPFFAWSTFYRPHQPYTPQAQFADKVDYASLKLPSTIWQKPEELPPTLCQGRRSKVLCWDLGDATEAMYRRYIGYYSALVTEIDHHIGSILDTLDREGLAENTIIVYSSDHGDFVAGHGMIEKFCWGHNVYEETLRVPLLFRWPGKIGAGVTRQDLVELVDLYPTLLSLCGIDLPGSAVTPVGRDISPTLTRQTPVGRPCVISENIFQASVITDDFKYAQWLNCPGPRNNFQKWGNMLFDRVNDPGEARNLIASPAHAAQRDKLAGYLRDWASRIDDRGRRDLFATAKTEYAVL
jgi:arylsulfatase A-like enzyme